MTHSVIHPPKGRITARRISSPEICARTHNDALAAYGIVASKLWAGDSKYRPRKIYVEYANVVDPEDPVTAPTVDPMDPAHAVAYYSSLSGVSGRDFLRADVLGIPEVGIEAGYTDYFSAGFGNLLRLLTQTSGTVGVHGKAFSHSSNSKICGAAVAAAPVEGDYTQDIVIARGYFAADDQLLKLDGSEIQIEWEFPFVLPV